MSDNFYNYVTRITENVGRVAGQRIAIHASCPVFLLDREHRPRSASWPWFLDGICVWCQTDEFSDFIKLLEASG